MAFDTGRGKQDNDVEDGTRWSAVLQQVYEASQDDAPWYQKAGVFLIWSVGIALAAGIATIVLLGVVDLFSAERLLAPRTMSDWLFWAAALILFGGLLAPPPQESEEPTQGKRIRGTSKPSVTRSAANVEPKADEKESLVDRLDRRRQRAVRRRLMQVYNPWRWRMWVASVFCFLLSMLAGAFA
jgi:hypothetical protein